MRVREQLAGTRCLASRQEMVKEVREARVGFAGAGPRRGGHVTNVEAFARVADRRSEQVGEGQPAEALGERHPSAHRPRHGDRVPAARRHALAPGESRRSPQRRGAPGGVQARQIVVRPKQGERVAAHAVAARLHHGEGDGGGERGVHGVAPLPQHVEAGVGGQRLRGRHHVARQHRRTSGSVGETPVEHSRPLTAGPVAPLPGDHKGFGGDKWRDAKDRLIVPVKQNTGGLVNDFPDRRAIGRTGIATSRLGIEFIFNVAVGKTAIWLCVNGHSL